MHTTYVYRMAVLPPEFTGQGFDAHSRLLLGEVELALPVSVINGQIIARDFILCGSL